METHVLHFFEHRLEEQFSSVPSRRTELVTQILSAADRIADGSYGNCTCCGFELPLHSLHANPARSMCVKCENQLATPPRI